MRRAENNQQREERVLMAMSGGVDSSVAALVLRDAGYRVEGVTLKLFDNEDVGEAPEKSCCSLSDAEDARQVCLDLGIPHVMYNFTRTFGSEVIERFCAGYLRCVTPNPCIDCNRYVKFAALQQRRRDLGFDYVATGHYARRCYNERTGRFELRRGLDANKDQSYVLFHLDQDTLAHMLFPLGDLSKPQVRRLASSHGFANAEKAESQDICFVPDGNYASFIAEHAGVEFEPGQIVDRDGRVLGRHAGLPRYTVGQRKGIGVAAGEPLYVFAKDAVSNRLIVGKASEVMCAGVEVADVNFIARERLGAPGRFTVKTHYRQTPHPCLVEQAGPDEVRITFDEPRRACAPGQAAVVYEGDAVVCGGTIAQVF